MIEEQKDYKDYKIFRIGNYDVGALRNVKNWCHCEDFCLYSKFGDIASVVVADGVSSEKDSYMVAEAVCRTFLGHLENIYKLNKNIEEYILNFDNNISMIINNLKNQKLTGASTFASVVFCKDKLYFVNIGNTDIYLLSMNYLDYIKPNIKQNIDVLTAAISPYGINDKVQISIVKIYENPTVVVMGTDGAEIWKNIDKIYNNIQKIYNNIYRDYGVFNIEKFMEELDTFFDEYLSDKTSDDASVCVLVLYNVLNLCVKYALSRHNYRKDVYLKASVSDWWNFIEKIEVFLPQDNRTFAAIGKIYIKFVKEKEKDLGNFSQKTSIFNLIIENKYTAPIIKIYLDSERYQIDYKCSSCDSCIGIENKMIYINLAENRDNTEKTKKGEITFKCKIKIAVDVPKF